jgi:tRNA pseudouridine13 synthase
MYKLKSIPEDFIVTEIANRTWQEQGPYLVVKVIKKQQTTEDIAAYIAQKTKKRRSDIAYAGQKDKQGITTQHYSIAHASENVIAWLSLKDVTFSFMGYTDEPLSLGSLSGNHFTITVRNVTALPQTITLTPNYFDEQRFSSANDQIGKALITKDFKKAAALIDEPHVKTALARQPENPINAIRLVPKKILTLYIHAYQSRLFNKVLTKLLEEKKMEELQTMMIPLIGFGTEDLSLYQDILSEEGITPRNFIISELPDLSSEGNERLAVINIQDIQISALMEDEFNIGMKKFITTFTLPKGVYATNVIKQLMKDIEDETKSS